jgi:hypothetical protein
LKKAGDVFLVEAVVAKVGDSVSDSAAGGAAAVVEGLGRNRPLQITNYFDLKLRIIIINQSNTTFGPRLRMIVFER